MKRSVAVALMLVAGGCKPPPDTPDATANAFLRVVLRQDCRKAWTFFSAASQKQIAAESVRVIKQQPEYTEEFKPENLFCKSTYANRYLSYVANSAKLQSVNDTNAVVIAGLREATDFFIPGFFPTKYKTNSVPMYLVRENSAWKIDLAGPRTPAGQRESARRRAIEYERQMVEEARQRQ